MSTIRETLRPRLATSGSPYGVMTSAADFVAPRPLAVTIRNSFKHLLMYADGRHPCFRYFSLNTEMRWRALQAGRIYVRQHPHDAQLFFVLTWLLFYHCSSITSTELPHVYIGMFAQARPPIALHSSSMYSFTAASTSFPVFFPSK